MNVPVNQIDSVDLGQVPFGKGDYGNRTTPHGVIPLMPNRSNWFTGQRGVIGELKRHFSNTKSTQERTFFLLYGQGGIGKTQICLKFIEEMSDW